MLALAFSPDGTLLATGSYFGRLDLWDVATQARHGKPMRVADDGVLSVAFDPSGRLVAGGGATGPVRVWRVADQQPAFPPLSGHTGPITGAAFDPTGSFLATTSLFGATRGCGTRRRVSATATSSRGSPKPGSLVPSVDLPFLGLRTRSARTAGCWPSRESRRARCCGTSTRRSGASARARSWAET